MWLVFAQLRMFVQIAVVVVSDWSDKPFMPEMPTWAYACASDQPNAVLSAFFRPFAAFTVLANMSAPPPKSNGMIVKTSTFAPSAAAWLIRRVPQNVGPVVPVPNVRMVLMPGLLALTVLRAL